MEQGLKGWQKYFALMREEHKTGQTYLPEEIFEDGSYIHKGSLMCRHGEEAGKACEICYQEWLKENKCLKENSAT
jgi:hypothetical protein